MRLLSKQLIVSLLFGLSSFYSSSVLSDENQVNEEAEFTQPTQLSDIDRSGGFLKLGFGYNIVTNPYNDEENGMSLFLNARYQWESQVFVEAAFYRVLNSGINIGYNFYNTERWNFDLVTNIAHGANETGFIDQGKVFYKKSDITRMAALRTTGSFDKTTVQFVVAPYSFNDEYDNALYASVWIDQSFQVKNWELYAAFGLEYRSEDMLDYYYGIEADRATDNFKAYNPSSGIDTTAELGASYPINNKWLFETYYRYTRLADSITDSPIMQFASTLESRSKNMTELGILVSYVF